MKHILLALCVLVLGIGTVAAGENDGLKVTGYLAPNLRLIDMAKATPRTSGSAWPSTGSR